MGETGKKTGEKKVQGGRQSEQQEKKKKKIKIVSQISVRVLQDHVVFTDAALGGWWYRRCQRIGTVKTGEGLFLSMTLLQSQTSTTQRPKLQQRYHLQSSTCQ